MKKISFLLIIFIILLTLSGCDSGLKIVSLEIGKPPNRIVYIANVDTELDLSGCTLIETVKSGRKYEYSATDAYITVNHSIDFTKVGIYEVEFIWNLNSKAIYKYLVQVIDDDIYNALKEGI